MVTVLSPIGRLSPVELQQIISAERRALPFLVYRDGAGVQRIREIGRRQRRISIGRAPGADLTLPWDQEVSALHAQLEAIGPEWTAQDDGLSTNGTFVNGRRINGRQRLADGDVVRVGRTPIAFHHPGRAPVAKTIPTGLPAVHELTPTQRRIITALCRPLKHAPGFAGPATNREIADDLSLSVDAVKTHLRALYRRFDLEHLPQNQKRIKLAEVALQTGLVTLRTL